MKLVSERWLVEPGSSVRLADHDPSSTDGAPGDRAATEAALPDLLGKIESFQDKLWAEAKRSLLIVLQGMDTAGKDGTIRHAFRGLNPQGTRVASFKEPTHLEAAHDFLWRVHLASPAAGEVTIFNRSHYEDVLIVRLHRSVQKDVWTARYDLINDFEALLLHGGTTVIKLFLHISKAEQRKRLEARLADPKKRWKYREGDVAERALWDDYASAYEDALSKTSTARAPWYVIPADRKWFRNWAVSSVIVETLRKMDPRYPTVIE